VWEAEDAELFRQFVGLDLKEEGSFMTTEVNSYEGYFHAIMSRFDQLENKLELISKVIDEVNNGNRPKDLPLNEFFSTFCALMVRSLSFSH